MATKIRAIGNVGSHNPQVANIFVGIISESTVPILNGRLIGFCVRGTDAHGLDISIQTQEWVNNAVNITKTATFPAELIPELLTYSEFSAAGLIENTAGVNNYSGSRVLLAAFNNSIASLTPGFKSVAFGDILAGGVTIDEMETYLNYDVNEDGVIGAIKKLQKAIDEKPAPVGFLDGLKTQADAISPYLYPVAKWGVIGIGVNLGVQALTGKPVIGKKGLIKL